MQKLTLKFFLFAVLALTFVACNNDDDDDVKLPTQITALTISSPVVAVGIVDEASKSIDIPVPFGTDVSNLVGTMTVSDGATVSPNLSAGVDFSGGAVTFTVTNGGDESTYSITATPGENPLRLALVGDAASVDDLDSEIKAAYDWALETYGNKAGYISFDDLTAESISTATALWFHYTTFPRPDIDNGEPIFPASATTKASTVVADFSKAGGAVLLTGLAGSYVAEMGRVAAEFGPTNFDVGGDLFIENPDNWGISYLPDVFNPDDYPAGNDGYYLFADLTPAPVTFEGVTYDAIFLSDPGAKKNRAHIWDFNRFFPDIDPGCADPGMPTLPNGRKAEFENQTGSKVRASFEWDPAACGIELGAIVEFEPNGDFQGTTTVIGLGAYEWNQEDGEPNQWQANVEGITANFINNFVD